MSSALPNTAALVSGSTEPGKYIQVQDIPYPKATEDQLIVKGLAFAINPTDWKHADFGVGKKGAVAGTDVAGTVETVGANVQGFSKGDFVSVFLHGNVDEYGAFQKFVVANPSTTVKLPSKFPVDPLQPGEYPSSTIQSFEGASTIPLGLATIGVSFAIELNIPLLQGSNSNKYILLWGGATATGILAIQIAKHVYGLKVLTTASKHNHEFLKSLGADEVFDYKDSSAIEELSKYDISYALDVFGTVETFQQTYDATKNSKDVRLDNLFAIFDDKIKKDSRSGKATFVTPTMSYIAVGHPVDAYGRHWNLTDEGFNRYKQFWFEALPKYLPELKHAGLKVLKQGFENADEGYTLNKEGKVSAQKIVFRA
ncbi:hypothetical protein BN7_2931 [Wickerhamomyces ciferrii]|uniref:Enoyl reductase (ER) domain-containing protein n=1 Tax=Wickerhamomyces ciferrii (strain ATCC 14091 / BCRC 22168 / CBS 111 / JCM 3599 / NBRC 0793 / NRRL Y-1031 F-60-10) TaxID=1206466 RepID=K0KQ89_WICCF|nr:uncharacterized protein BN7_2931 [Wickerhamomyces ciferrii]CCH43383.1 hypothetical protein BN7_2931 [Wickerhamomyces ciferrii]